MFSVTCEPSNPADTTGIGAPVGLNKLTTGSYGWELSWPTAYACEGICTGAPGPNMKKRAGSSADGEYYAFEVNW